MNAKHNFLTVCLLMLLTLSGCVTAPLAVDGSESIGPEQGLMAVRFLSDWKGNESIFHEAISFSVHPEGASMSEVLKMRSNDDAQLIALPPGKYSFVRTSIGNNYLNLEDGDEFTITAGEITYVGDMTIQVVQKPFLLAISELNVVNNEAETIARLGAEYGALIKGYPVTVQIISPKISDERW